MYVNYHRHGHHSNLFTLDCITKPVHYMERMKELGHTTYVTTEHGWGGDIFEAYELCQKYGYKCVFGAEVYYVTDRHEKDKSNYHLLLIAMNESGRKEINKILSQAHIDGYYYKPRIDRELLLSLTPENVMVSTACIASPLLNLSMEEFFIPIFNHFKNHLYLEVQNHLSEIQIVHNKKVIELSRRYGCKIIHGNDSHYIYPEQKQYRDLFLKGKGLNYGAEDTFMLDYPDEQTIIERYKKQGILTDDEINAAINNTNDVNNSTGIKLDKEFKIPKIVNGDSNKVLKKLLNEKWNKEKSNIPKEQHKHYINEIKYEMDMIEKCGMADYFLIDHDCVKKAIEEYGAVLTRTGRGSAVSFYINKLLGLTELDRIWCPVKLYPTRFLTDTRILESRSLPDIDLNFADAEPVIKATKDILGDDGCVQMICYKNLQTSSAFRLWCKSNGMNISEYEDIAKELDKNNNPYSDDSKWGKIIEDSKIFVGVIESVAPSPCSYLLYDKSISEEIGYMKLTSKTNKKEVMCCNLTGYYCDVFKYLKNDYLVVSVWDIISQVYKAINKPIDNIKDLLNKIDDKVWDLFADGITATINQCDSDYDKQILMKYKPRSFEEISLYVAAIRPGFKSQLDDFLNRVPHTTGEPELDLLFKDSFSFLAYQESIMSYLVWLGIPEKSTYDIIKKISKKKFTPEQTEELKNTLRKNWIIKIGNDNNFEKTWQVIEDSVKYLFNASHSCSVGLDGLYGAYLKANYPFEYYTVVLNFYSNDRGKITALTNELSYFGIKLYPSRFRYSSAGYIPDKSNNAIYKGIASIKNLNTEMGEQLYTMRDIQFDTFLDFLKVNPCNSKQTEILIKLDFFSEFGKSGKLMQIYNFYQTRYDKDKFKKQIRKDKNPYPIEILSKYSKETEKQFNIIDEAGFCSEMLSTFKDKDLPITERLQAQSEYLGYLEYVNPKAKNYAFITDLDTKYSPKVTCYLLDTGETVVIKMDKKMFNSISLKKHQVIKFTTEDKPKRKLVDGYWTESEETEKWFKSCFLYK